MVGVTGGQLRVLMLLGNNPYPDDPRVRNEAVTLTEGGHRVTVLAPRARGQPRRAEVDGVSVIRYPALAQPRSTLSQVADHVAIAVAALGASILVARRDRFDVVHVHNPPDTLGVVAALWQQRGRRMVFDLHDLAAEMHLARSGEAHRGGAIHRALHALERWCCRRADLVITTNQSYRRLAVHDFGVDPDRIVVVRNGPDLAQFPTSAPEDGRQGHLVCYGGVIGRQDGLDQLVRAMHHVVHRRRRSDVRCVVVGAGDALASGQELAADLELVGSVDFTGLVAFDELVAWMRRADVCVEPAPSNPYNDRSTTIKVMEYMAAGRPVVAFDLPEHRVSGGDALVFVPSEDVAALGDAIIDLVDDPDRRAHLGQLGRQRVERCLAWPRQAAMLRQAYDELAAGEGR